MNIDEIKTELYAIAPFTVPKVRILAKRIAREDYRYFLDNNPKDTFELRLLHAFVLGYAKDDINTLIDYFEKFIPYVDDWGVNDSLCQGFKIARKYPEKTYKMLMKYTNSRSEFESRIVSVTLLSHFLTDDYIDRVIDILDSLYAEEYYAQMGIAWAVATVMAKYPDKCMAYLEQGHNHLNDRTYNMALRKIRESYRVSEDIKQWTKTMKR